MKKISKVLLSIVAVLLLAGVGCTSFFSIMAFKTAKTTADQVAVLTAAAEEEAALNSTETREDDVRIAEQYVIRSTTAISDAYKSGDTSELSDEDLETLEMASAVLDKIITDDMTDFEKEKAVYDWMCENLGHDDGMMSVVTTGGNEVDCPHGVLNTKKAVCVGFATTFRLFMQMMDIECMVVHNTDNYHSWDLVKIEGNWYHTDIYSDVDNGNYSNFNQTDAMRMQNWTWDTSFWPAANSFEYNMCYQNKHEIDSVSEIPTIISDALNSDIMTLCFTFNGGVDDDTRAQANGVMQVLYDIIMSSSYLDTQDDIYYLNSYGFMDVDGEEILYVSMDHYNLSNDNGSGDSSVYTYDFDQDTIDAFHEAFEGNDSAANRVDDYVSGDYLNEYEYDEYVY